MWCVCKGPYRNVEDSNDADDECCDHHQDAQVDAHFFDKNVEELQADHQCAHEQPTEAQILQIYIYLKKYTHTCIMSHCEKNKNSSKNK